MFGFSHVTFAEDELKHTSDEYICVSCISCWTDSACIVKHAFINHIVYLCLYCDNWVKEKLEVLDVYWNLFDEKGNLISDV